MDQMNAFSAMLSAIIVMLAINLYSWLQRGIARERYAWGQHKANLWEIKLISRALI